MLLSEGDRLVILACLKWAAMAHDKMAKDSAAGHDMKEAARRAAFSAECARLADAFEKRN